MAYWKNKRVLVTGGAGFLGAHVVKKLESAGCGSIFVPRQKEYNLVEMGAVKRVFKESSPDIVFHLAAEVGGIGANQKKPGKFFYNNTMMGAQLLEEARKNGVEKIVAMGTVCSYPKFAKIPFKEENLWDGYPEETNAPYGIAKKTLLVQARAYREEYGLNTIFLLSANLCGPGENVNLETSHVIPAIIKKCFDAIKKNENKIILWGTGKPTREFLYVEDCAEAILLAAEKYNKPDPVNLGTGSEVSIKDLAKLIAELTGFNGVIVWDKTKPDGQPRRKLDTEKAKKEFGFTSKTTLREGLRKTIQQYKKVHTAPFTIDNPALSDKIRKT